MFDEVRFDFYVTNAPKSKLSKRQVAFAATTQCNQENLIEQLKNGVRAMRLPVADLVAFFLYLESFYAPVRNLSGAWEAVQSSLAGADRVAGLLAEPKEPQTVRGAAPVTKDRSKGARRRK